MHQKISSRTVLLLVETEASNEQCTENIIASNTNFVCLQFEGDVFSPNSMPKAVIFHFQEAVSICSFLRKCQCGAGAGLSLLGSVCVPGHAEV